MVHHAIDDDDFIEQQCDDYFHDVRILLIPFITVNAISAFLSIIGSSIILYIILSGGREKLHRVQNRLVFCVSIIDIFNSTALGFSVLPIPKATCSYGFGNIATCTVQGFFIQLGMAVPGYMAMLSVSCFLSIVLRVSERTIVHRCEVFMHVIALLPMLSVAIAGAVGRVYNSETGQCWFEETLCKENCKGFNLKGFGNSSWMVLVTIIWIAFTICIIFITMLGIYFTIRNRATKMRSYEFQPKGQSQTNLERQRQPSAIERRAYESAKQAMLYICSYVLTYIWSGIHLCLYRGRSDVVYMLTGIFLPMQGFWNFLVYIRPRFIGFRRERHGLSAYSTLKAVIFTATNDETLIRSPRIQRRLTLNQHWVCYRTHQFASTIEGGEHVHYSTTNGIVEKNDELHGDSLSLFSKN